MLSSPWMAWIKQRRPHTFWEVICCLVLITIIYSLAVRSSRNINVTTNFTHNRKEVTILAGGDVLLGRHIGQLLQLKNSTFPFANLRKEIAQTDFFTYNLEGPVGNLPKSPFSLTSNQPFLVAINTIVQSKVKLVNLANDQIFNCSKKTFGKLITALDTNYIKHVGAGRNLREAKRPVFIKLGKVHLAVFGVNLNLPTEFRGKHNKPYIAGFEASVINKIKHAKKKADFILVHIHWGNLYANHPTKKQIRLAHELINAGANIIIGHHPHVLQPIEQYHGGVIAYSLGNLVFDQGYAITSQSILLQLQLTKGSPIGWKALPIKIKRGQVFPLTHGVEYQLILKRLEGSNLDSLNLSLNRSIPHSIILYSKGKNESK